MLGPLGSSSGGSMHMQQRSLPEVPSAVVFVKETFVLPPRLSLIASSKLVLTASVTGMKPLPRNCQDDCKSQAHQTQSCQQLNIHCMEERSKQLVKHHQCWASTTQCYDLAA